MYRRHLGLNQDLMIWPWQIKDAVAKDIKAFLFVDDFMGTGDQSSYLTCF
jgi:hypothetical protein